VRDKKKTQLVKNLKHLKIPVELMAVRAAILSSIHEQVRLLIEIKVTEGSQ
jgi:hypothetical protein